jgi:hypothetical protein
MFLCQVSDVCGRESRDPRLNTTVTTGTLSIVIRQASNAVPGGVGTDINAIQIVPGGPGYIRSIPGHMP